MEDGRVQTVQYSALSDTSDREGSPPVTYSPTPPSFRPGRIIKRYDNRPQIKRKGLPPRGWFGFLADGFTTIIDARWYQIIFLFWAVYISSWLLFSFLWLAVDAAYESVRNQTCIENLNDFSSAFLYSLETQLTIGYGFRYISSSCSIGILFLIVQSIVGLMIDSFLIGLVFAKITRPSSRRQTILFSNSAVMYEEDGERYLEFRVADARKSQLVEGHVRVTLYWYKEEENGGEQRTLRIHDLEVGYESGEDRLILLTPVCVRHLIGPKSPLVSVTPANMLQQDFEIVVALEAIVESTGLTLQALWSYTEREIMNGYRFKPMIYRQSIKDESWEVDYRLLSHTILPTTGSI